MKSLIKYLAIISLLMLSSCMGEGLYELQKDDLSFEMSISSPLCTKSSVDSTWIEPCEGLETLMLLSQSSWEATSTKSAPVNVVHDSVALFAYRYKDWSSDIPSSLSGALLRKVLSAWRTEENMLFDSSAPSCKMRFYAYAPYSARGVSVTSSKGGLQLDYTVPENVSNQSDLIYGTSAEYQADYRNPSLHFEHLLSCVTFSVSGDCTAATLRSISLRNIALSASYSPDRQWYAHGNIGIRSLSLSTSVVPGMGASVSSGSKSMMLIPQTLSEDAVLEIELLVGEDIVLLETSLASQEWKKGYKYNYELSFDADPYNSSITYEVDLSHKISYLYPNTRVELPMMTFVSGTQRIKIDWGDGSEQVFTSTPSSGYLHDFPANYRGNVIVKIKGTSPGFTRNTYTAQRIRKIRIEGNESYDSRDGCNCIIQTASSMLVYAGIEYTIPSSVKKIAARAFITVQTPQIVIPEGVEEIKYEAFSGANQYVRSVTLPSSLRKLEDGAFFSYSINNVSVDPANPVYDSRNNCNCVMETATDYIVAATRNSVILPETKGVRPYGLTVSPARVELPSSCTYIGENAAINNSSMRYLRVPRGCHIYYDAFRNTLLETVDYSEGEIILEPGAFSYNRAFVDVDLSKFSYLGARAFTHCKELRSLNIPEGYTIRDYAFSNCPSLYTVNIPRFCQIGEFAFAFSGLVTLHIASTPGYTNHKGFTFAYCEKLTEVNVYDGCDEFDKYDFSLSPVTRFNFFNTRPPALFQCELYRTAGQVHVKTEIDFYGWFNQSVFPSKAWTMVADLQ